MEQNCPDVFRASLRLYGQSGHRLGCAAADARVSDATALPGDAGHKPLAPAAVQSRLFAGAHGGKFSGGDLGGRRARFAYRLGAL
jgi:hypothetical protein